MAHAFVLIMAVMVFVNVLVYVCMHPILWFLRVPQEVMEEMQQSVMISTKACATATRAHAYRFSLYKWKIRLLPPWKVPEKSRS